MPVTLHLIVKPYGFVPETATDEEAARVFRLGAVIKAQVTRAKSQPMLRFYWALVDKVATGIGYDKECLSHDLLIAARRVDSYTLSNGWVRIRPRRISQMDRFEFDTYVVEAIQHILRDYLPDMTRGALVADVETMTGVKAPEDKPETKQEAA